MTSGLITALGWSLVHFLWQGCVIAVLYWLVCVISRPESAHLRYWAGVGGLALCLVSLLSTLAIYFGMDARFVPIATPPDPVNPFLVLSGGRPDVWGMLQQGIEPALPAVVALWICGVLTLTIRTANDWLRVRGLVRDGVADVTAKVRTSARYLERCLGLRRAVTILQSSRVAVPMAIGWIRPVILIPAGVMARLPHDQLEMVLAHELGHIRRYDHIVNWLQVALETLLFYHPAIRWISRRVREERENCCDDLVVARCRKPATYARALTNLELLRGAQPVAVMAATGGNLLGRIRRIIDTELPRTSTGYAQLSLMAAVALLVAFGTHQGVALSRALDEVAGIAQLQPSDVAWKTWGRSRAAWGEGLSGFADLDAFPAPPAPGGSPARPVSPGAGEPAAPRIGKAALPPAAPLADQDDTSAATVRPGAGLKAGQPAPADVPALPEIVPPVIAQLPQRSGNAPAAAVESSVTPKPMVPSGPVVLDRFEPHYPRRARVNGVEGFVELAFSIDADGRPYDIAVVDAIPSGVFERASKKALRRWKFQPEAETGAESRLTQTFDFNLADVNSSRSRRKCALTGSRTCSLAPSAAIVVYVNPPSKRAELH